MHTLTSESQDITVGSIAPRMSPLSVCSTMLETDIPHRSQLNNTTSTPLTAIKFKVLAKLMVSDVNVLERTVSSWLAHLFPFSPKSMGISPSNSTLEAGLRHTDVVPLLVTLAQRPVAEDPFTDRVSAVEKLN